MEPIILCFLALGAFIILAFVDWEKPVPSKEEHVPVPVEIQQVAEIWTPDDIDELSEAFNKAQDGDSGEAEIDAACALRDAAQGLAAQYRAIVSA